MVSATPDVSGALAVAGEADAPAGAPEEAIARGAPSFEAVYDEWFEFVWRSVRRLGVADASLDDAVQDVFVVVHRQLPAFEGRSSMKTWLFGIALRVARDHHRAARRKGGLLPLTANVADAAAGPYEQAVTSEAVRELDRLLAELDEDKRVVFILAELEQMTAPEIAEAVGINVNTAYSRMRAARLAFEAALARRKEEDR
jgi:RNA polymerase sigma-70 factor (ECF subfamily)